MPIDRQRIMAIAEESFNDTVYRLGAEFKKQISAAKWGWIDGEERDIVDKGRLRSSQREVIEPSQGSRFKARIEYPVKYAAPVHNGGVFRKGPLAGRSFPARPWTRVAFREFNTMRFYRRSFNARLKGEMGAPGDDSTNA